MTNTDLLWWAALLVQLLAIPGTLLPVLPGLVLLPLGALLWCWAVGFGVAWPVLLLARKGITSHRRTPLSTWVHARLPRPPSHHPL